LNVLRANQKFLILKFMFKNLFSWFMWIWCHFNGMKVNPWKLMKSQGEIRFVQEIQSIKLLHSWNVIYSWSNKIYILYYSWMNFISLWDFKKFSWMDFHPIKNGLESTSLIKMDQKRKKFKSKPFNLFPICSKHNLRGNLNFWKCSSQGSRTHWVKENQWKDKLKRGGGVRHMQHLEKTKIKLWIIWFLGQKLGQPRKIWRLWTIEKFFNLWATWS
jgi:hypothetical protein